eukprot:CAMPEP_0178992330 /NCGR_PEP_ID=MMETSP0795-20121207/6050_1 /TAXON_ID=88552 /ORGANISM="Amoebophrya sp., Strain Ameob2" /LENGTH=183 /DNA_ID=CAMNT_0020684191 /DNA_START=1301 /DNA_END=1853 /DNA_ORIENTATION=-
MAYACHRNAATGRLGSVQAAQLCGFMLAHETAFDVDHRLEARLAIRAAQNVAARTAEVLRLLFVADEAVRHQLRHEQDPEQADDHDHEQDDAERGRDYGADAMEASADDSACAGTVGVAVKTEAVGSALISCSGVSVVPLFVRTATLDLWKFPTKLFVTYPMGVSCVGSSAKSGLPAPGCTSV